jgi:hypothetical protein
MRLVAESIETIRMPITARQANAFIDPSNSGSRGITVALKFQGSYPVGGDFSIAGTWEQDLTVDPDDFWIAFISPGNLVRNKKYVVFAKLAAFNGETPILEAPGLIDVV